MFLLTVPLWKQNEDIHRVHGQCRKTNYSHLKWAADWTFLQIIFKSQLPQGIGMEVVVGVGQYVVVTVGGFGAVVAEAHHYDFAFSKSSSCEVVA